MDTRQLSKEFVLEFLEIYRSQPCLWKIKSKEYSNRDLKQKSYALLIDKLREVDQNADKEMVIKKIDSFKGSFRKELKKVEASKKTGTGEGDTYKLKLWYFEQLMFLLDQEIPTRSMSNMDQTQTEFSLTDEISVDTDDSNIVEAEDSMTSPTTSSTVPVQSRVETPVSTASSKSTTLTKKKKQQSDDLTMNILKKVAVQSDTLDSPQDEFSVIGMNIGNKLRKLPTETAIVVEKLFFMYILLEAQLANITRHTRMNLVDSKHFSFSVNQNDHVSNTQQGLHKKLRILITLIQRQMKL